jgi:hypothetical protein
VQVEVRRERSELRDVDLVGERIQERDQRVTEHAPITAQVA